MNCEPFSAADVKRCREPHAVEFTKALLAVVKAEAALEWAKEQVPSYTGPNSAEDYYAEEQEAFNRAADEVTVIVRRISHPVRLGPQ